MIVLTIATSIMYCVYTMCYYIWAIGQFLGHFLCHLLLYLGDIASHLYTFTLLIKDDFHHFLVDLDQGRIYMGDLIYSVISAIIYGSVEVITTIHQLVHNLTIISGQQTKLLLKRFIIGCCGCLSIIRQAVILIAQIISWSLALIPRFVYYTIAAVIDNTKDVVIYLKATLFYEFKVMATDKKFLISVFIITMFITFSWSQRRLLIRLASRTVKLFKLHPKLPANVRHTEDISNICVVCLELPKSILLLPCKHFCLCSQCAEIINSNCKSCPLCRKDINSTMLVFA